MNNNQEFEVFINNLLIGSYLKFRSHKTFLKYLVNTVSEISSLTSAN